jgi:hypothetical protein
MNILNILGEIEQHDPEVYARLDTRRAAMRQFANLGKKLTAAAVPVALGSMFQKAYGQTSSVLDVLNFALLLEYLEAEFYAIGLRQAPIPNGSSREAIGIIADHEAKHVKFLQTAISAAGGTPISKPKFDLSGGSGSGNGPFKNAFNDYGFFLAVAQTLEDTGVRAYKGQAPNLLGTGDVLTAALNIHSVEARHASHIRKMRRELLNMPSLKPWISGLEAGLGSANGLVYGNYVGEENTKQAGIEITNINNFPVTPNGASESFDEPLTRDQVVAVVKGFLS